MNNLTKRVLSAVVLVPPVIGVVFFAPPWAMHIVIGLLAALAGYEYGNITLKGRFQMYRVLMALTSSFCALSVSLWPALPWAPLAAMGLVSMLYPIAFMFGRSELKNSVPAAAFGAAGSFYTGALVGFIGLLYVSQPNGGHWVFSLLFGTFFGDTAAYTAGRIAGRRKLAPRISPGKTWAGAVGGLVGTCAAFAISKLFLLTDLSWAEVFILAVPTSVACQVGDLAESFLKRGFGVKDSGRLIPGHGGILDRIDALMFGAPIVFLFSLLR
ncbi:MAG: CDP-archaeol synthase [Deltaproteobacteria bacterium]|nr:CDP-archaeol synthase [Deltaproteobacteria bacterium]